MVYIPSLTYLSSTNRSPLPLLLLREHALLARVHADLVHLSRAPQVRADGREVDGARAAEQRRDRLAGRARENVRCVAAGGVLRYELRAYSGTCLVSYEEWENVLREGTVPYVREEAGPGRDDEVEEAERLYQALGGGYNSGPYVRTAEGWLLSCILHVYADDMSL